jgi:hypothetical protein
MLQQFDEFSAQTPPVNGVPAEEFARERRPNGRTFQRDPISQTAAEAAGLAQEVTIRTWGWFSAAVAAVSERVYRLLPGWPIMWARFRYWAFQAITKPFFAVVYFAVISEGLRVIAASTASKLYKLPIPYFAMLADSEEGARLDVAHLMALALLLAVWYFGEKAIQLWLRPGETPEEGYDYDNYRRLVTTFAAMAIGGDAVCFYVAITEMGWGGSSLSFTGAVATMTYVSVLLFVSLVCVNLKKKIEDIKKGGDS